MTDLARKLPDAPAVSDAIRKARARGLELVSDNLPRVADATDRAGKNLANFIRSSADSLSTQVRKQKPSTASRLSSALGASLLVRLARRHPVALLIGGAAIAAAGVAAWRATQAQPVDSPDDSLDHEADVSVAPAAAKAR